MPARLVRLFVSPGHNFFGRHGMGADDHVAVEVESAECVAGKGIRGDRFFDHKPDYKGQITFFDLAVFRELLATFGLGERQPSLVRRNAFTEGLDLNALIGREFTLQGVRFLGVEECKPCYWMDTALAPGAEAFLKGRGGLRCRILSDGVIHAGRECEERREESEVRTDTVVERHSTPDASISALRTHPSFCGLVLAGGRSTRMGEDKAFLEVGGEPLIARQARVLREAGCKRIVISGRRDVDYATTVPGCETVFDSVGEGPLAGIAAALETLTTEETHLLTIPVDLPELRTATLANLMRACTAEAGAIAGTETGVEPLVAAIPRDMREDIRTEAASGGLSPKRFFGDSSRVSRITVVDPRPHGTGDDFINWNRREDWSPPVRGPAPPG